VLAAAVLVSTGHPMRLGLRQPQGLAAVALVLVRRKTAKVFLMSLRQHKAFGLLPLLMKVKPMPVVRGKRVN